MKNLDRLRLPHPAGLLVCLALCTGVAQAAANRTVLSLDGPWGIAEGGMSSVPGQFERRVPVPGLVDEARPPFSEVGQKSAQREAFWYRRTFKVKGEVPAVALLKVHKAAYGSRVLLNGILLGEHLPSFTPGYFDARPALRGHGAVNELLVRVGASREAGEPAHAGNIGGSSVWFAWTAPTTGTVTINTAGSSFDTLLAVYTGSSVSGLAAVASNDDANYPVTLTSAVTFHVVAGQTYRIAVDGWNGAAGNIMLNLAVA